jgi:hypothetical protein
MEVSGQLHAHGTLHTRAHTHTYNNKKQTGRRHGSFLSGAAMHEHTFYSYSQISCKLIFLRHIYRRWDSSVGIAMGYRLNGRGSITGRVKIFLFSTASRPALRPTQPSIQWVLGALPGGKAARA